jgi:hypothetical protein
MPFRRILFSHMSQKVSYATTALGVSKGLLFSVWEKQSKWSFSVLGTAAARKPTDFYSNNGFYGGCKTTSTQSYGYDVRI